MRIEWGTPPFLSVKGDPYVDSYTWAGEEKGWKLGAPLLHDRESHVTFQTPSGIRTVVCFCPCNECWPEDESACPDSTGVV